MFIRCPLPHCLCSHRNVCCTRAAPCLSCPLAHHRWITNNNEMHGFQCLCCLSPFSFYKCSSLLQPINTYVNRALLTPQPNHSLSFSGPELPTLAVSTQLLSLPTSCLQQSMTVLWPRTPDHHHSSILNFSPDPTPELQNGTPNSFPDGCTRG